MPKVSVIIPVYNVEQYLPTCLESVLQQTLRDIEVICINDGSTDDSLTILREYAKKDARLFVISQPHSGAGAARNRGLQAVTSDYVFFMDSDDRISSEALQILYEKILLTQVDIAICQYCLFSEKSIQWNNPLGLTFKLLPNQDVFSSWDVAKHVFQLTRPSIFIKLYKTSLISNHQIYFQEIPSCNDVFFNAITLLCAERITCIRKPLVFYRECRKGSISSSRHLHAQCILAACQAIQQWITKHSEKRIFLHSLYQFAAEYFAWEIKQVSQTELQLRYFQTFQTFLPYSYLQDFIHYSHLQQVFIPIIRNGKRKILFNPRMLVKSGIYHLKKIFYIKRK